MGGQYLNLRPSGQPPARQRLYALGSWNRLAVSCFIVPLNHRTVSEAIAREKGGATRTGVEPASPARLPGALCTRLLGRGIPETALVAQVVRCWVWQSKEWERGKRLIRLRARRVRRACHPLNFKTASKNKTLHPGVEPPACRL